jgi:hypothetical protein
MVAFSPQGTYKVPVLIDDRPCRVVVFLGIAEEDGQHGHARNKCAGAELEHAAPAAASALGRNRQHGESRVSRPGQHMVTVRTDLLIFMSFHSRGDECLLSSIQVDG